MWKIGQLAEVLAAPGALAAMAQGLMVAGHALVVQDDGIGRAALAVDARILHDNAAICLDEAMRSVGGRTVVTGSAGHGR